MSYLCDSDWMIDLIARRSRALQVLPPLMGQGLNINIIAVGEVLEGIYAGRNAVETEGAFDALLERVPVINLDRQTMQIYALTRASLRRSGSLIGDNDLLIAATALRHDLTLVTRNRRHFARIPDLRILAESD